MLAPFHCHAGDEKACRSSGMSPPLGVFTSEDMHALPSDIEDELWLIFRTFTEIRKQALPMREHVGRALGEWSTRARLPPPIRSRGASDTHTPGARISVIARYL